MFRGFSFAANRQRRHTTREREYGTGQQFACVNEANTECRITFTFDQDHALEYILSDKAKIMEWVVEPLRSAKVDRTPARYVILGSLTVGNGDDTTDQVFLFLPFGRAKRGDTYLIADFSKLGEHLGRIFQHLASVTAPNN